MQRMTYTTRDSKKDIHNKRFEEGHKQLEMQRRT